MAVATDLHLLAPFDAIARSWRVDPGVMVLATDHIYGDPAHVGMALSTVAAPAIVACCLLFFVAARAASGTLNAIARA